MKKLNKVALLLATAALATVAGAQGRVTAANGGNVIDNWQNGTGEYGGANGPNKSCGRDANWPPAPPPVGCDGALVVVPPPPPPAPVARPAPPPPPAPAPAPQPPAATKVTYAADAFFDF